MPQLQLELALTSGLAGQSGVVVCPDMSCCAAFRVLPSPVLCFVAPRCVVLFLIVLCLSVVWCVLFHAALLCGAGWSVLVGPLVWVGGIWSGPVWCMLVSVLGCLWVVSVHRSVVVVLCEVLNW